MWIPLRIRSDTLADLFRHGHVQVESLRPTADPDHTPNQETALQLHTAIMRYLDQLRDPCQRMQLKVLAHTLAQSYFQTPPRR